MSELRDWLTQFGADKLIEHIRTADLNEDELNDLSELTEQRLPEQFVELATKSLRQLDASQKLLTRPQNRQVSVLFIDLVGSTALGQRLGDEKALPLKNKFRKICRDAIDGYGGNIMYSHHDEVVACFGFPLARERDAERAVFAAVQINDTLNTQTQDEPLQIRAGVSTARSIVGAIDPEEPELINAGTVVSHAARLSEIAQPGEIIVSESTQALAGDSFEFTYTGTQNFNGFEQPQQSWKVNSILHSASLFTVTGLSPFIARQQELSLLLSHWQMCCENQGLQCACISGVAGIGKSRLAREFRQQLSPHGSEVLLHCSLYHSNSALFPVKRYLMRSLGISAELSDDERQKKLTRLVSDVKTKVEHPAPHLCLLLDLPIDSDHPVKQMSAEKRRLTLFKLLRDVLLHYSSLTPLLIEIEDIHWADPTTLQLMKYLAEELSAHSIMLLFTARADINLPAFIAKHETIELAPLEQVCSAELVKSLNTCHKLSDSAIENIVSHCDGVPMYVEEVTKTYLHSDDQQLTNALTPRLNDLLTANLDRVGSARSTAQLASVIGRSFSINMLESISDLPSETVQDHIKQLRDNGLLQERLDPTPTMYFRHALLRDCSYDTLLEDEKRMYHGRVASALDRSNSVPAEVLARHLAIAEHFDESILKWQEAARTATHNGAFVEACAHLEAALKLVPTDARDEPTQRTRQELLLRMLPALIGSVSYGSKKVQTVMDEAIALSRDIGVDSRIFPFFYGRWVNTQAMGRHTEAFKYSQEFMHLAAEHGDKGAMTAAHINAAWSAFNLSDFFLAQNLLTEAGTLRKETQSNKVGFAYATDSTIGLECGRVQVLWCLGKHSECRQASAHAIQRCTQIENEQSIFIASQYAGAMTHILLRDWVSAKQYGQAMMGMKKIAGATATGHFYATIADMHLTKSDAQIDIALDTEKHISAMGFKYLMPFWLTCIAEVVLCHGKNTMQAETLLSRALDTIEHTREHWFKVECLRLQAMVSIKNGDEGSAAELFTNAIQLAKEQHSVSFGCRAAFYATRHLADPAFETELQHFKKQLGDETAYIELIEAEKAIDETY